MLWLNNIYLCNSVLRFWQKVRLDILINFVLIKKKFTLIFSTPSTTPAPIAYILLNIHGILLKLKVIFIVMKYFIDKIIISVCNEGVKSAFPQLFWEQLESLHQSHKHCGNGHSHKPCRNGILWQIMPNAVNDISAVCYIIVIQWNDKHNRCFIIISDNIVSYYYKGFITVYIIPTQETHNSKYSFD